MNQQVDDFIGLFNLIVEDRNSDFDRVLARWEGKPENGQRQAVTGERVGSDLLHDLPGFTAVSGILHRHKEVIGIFCEVLAQAFRGDLDR